MLEQSFKDGPSLRNLIITSGDISDVDGFFAVAEYAKTGADLLFIMNYPAYIGISQDKVQPDGQYEKLVPGLGYAYSSDEVLKAVPSPAPAKYTSFMARYESNLDSNQRMKSAMTDMAHCITKKVWNEAKDRSSNAKLYFCVGGINKINPFSSTAVKNEMLVFAESALEDCVRLDPTQEALYDEEGRQSSLDLRAYNGIYIDFNGSMAFFSETSRIYMELNQEPVCSKIRGAFIMGGIYADETPKTMPSISGTLNRFSCATMNQLYHPANSARFFAFLERHGVPAFTITNNAVHDLSTFASGPVGAPGPKTFEGVQKYLDAQALHGPFLAGLARAYYENPHGQPPRKAFDHYAALALTCALRSGADALRARAAPRSLHYCGAYGVALVSAAPSWPEALAAFTGRLDTAPHEGDAPFVAAKKQSLLRESAAIAALPALPSLSVQDLSFDLDPSNHRLSIARHSAPEVPAPAPAAPAAAQVPAAAAAS